MSESTQLDVIVELQDKFSNKSAAIESSLARMSKTGDGLKKTFTGIGERFGSEFGLIQKAAKLGAAGIVAAGAGIVAFGLSSVKAFAEAQATGARFEHSMKAIAKASDEEVKSLQRQQEALSKVTRFDDEAIASGQGFLATFQLNQKQIEKLTPRLLDMAEGLRDSTGATIGLEGASNMLGKALQLGTVGMLAKAGVTIPGTTKAMQDLFKAKFEVASIEERTAMLSDLVDGNFKGQAETAGKTLAGQLVILGNTYDNLKETVGGALAEGIAPFVQALKEFVSSDQMKAYVEQLTERIHAWVESIGGPEGIRQKFIELKDKIITEVIPAMVTIFNKIVEVTKFIWEHRDAIIAAVIVWESFKIALSIVEVIAATSKAIAALTGFLVAQGSVMGALAAVALPALGVALAALAAVAIFKAIKAWQDLKKTQDDIRKSSQDVSASLDEMQKKVGSLSTEAANKQLQNSIDKARELNKEAERLAKLGFFGSLKEGFKNLFKADGGIVPQHLATGGVVYASGGFMEPRGTDTIPAMLTPGEMVLNAGQQARLFNQLNGSGRGTQIILSGDNYFYGEADEDRLIDKMRTILSRENEQSNWGIA